MADNREEVNIDPIRKWGYLEGGIIAVLFIFNCLYFLLADFKCIMKKMTWNVFVYCQTLIKLYNQLAGCQAPDSQQTPSSITLYARRNPCCIWRLGFGVGQMRLLFGGITNRIEKIHQTRESSAANSHSVYTMAGKAQPWNTLYVHSPIYSLH